ncbi:MAG: aconitate hydratase AcnA [bacterium]
MILPEKTKRELVSSNKTYSYYSLPALETSLHAPIHRLPFSLRIILESVVRNCDGKNITATDVETLARWRAHQPVLEEIPFTVSRVILQDFTGVPLLVDLAAMRAAAARMGKNPKIVEPLAPVHLVVDHSVQVDKAGSPEAFEFNMQLDFKRNKERYQFLKWGQQSFRSFKVIPPGVGIIHQVNLEYLAEVVTTKQDDNQIIVMPDTLVGTDSHTTMINGMGVVGWGVGGIEAEAAMLGQPVRFLTPEVVGVYLTGKLYEGVTATDLAITVTQLLRANNVVGKFVEFYGPGATQLSLPDRATVANMAPEYGATLGFFGVDEETLRYLQLTGRSEEQVSLVRDYFQAQSMFGIPQDKETILYSRVIELDLSAVAPSVAGPKRPQDRIGLSNMKSRFEELLCKPVLEGGYGKSETQKTDEKKSSLTDGVVTLAAITSCTNTSNPSVMLAAGLLAKKAVEHGLQTPSWVKTSLAPGSRAVTEYLKQFQPHLDKLGFHLVGYGCATCIGNSGPLAPEIEKALNESNVIAASVLSGNRNFEARIHPAIKANFLMSPPLVIAFALAGRVDIDTTTEPLGMGNKGQPVYLRDIWPSSEEIRDALQSALSPELFRKLYDDLKNPFWEQISAPSGDLYEWDKTSSYIQEPPFFEDFSLGITPPPHLAHAHALAIFGDSITTDHISPAGRIAPESPAGQYLIQNGVKPEDFNSYGARRGNDCVMTRGTFANVRVKNLMVAPMEGGFTLMDGRLVTIYDAAMAYQKEGIPLVIFGGKEYGTGSSRDWAAKGTRLLGVRAVIAESFERIHRSNLVGMGVLPCCFKEGTNAQTLKLDGSEIFTLHGLNEDFQPRQKLELEIKRNTGAIQKVPLILRIDTPIEKEYYRYGGILPFVLKTLLKKDELNSEK